MDNLYGDSAGEEFNFDSAVLAEALKRIYHKDFNPAKEIEENLFNAVCGILNKATDEGFGKREADDPDFYFYQELKYNNSVFAAFKVHRAQNDMAALLLDSNGNLKSFEQWSNEVLPIADHQFKLWLKTEYDTAISRAHQAADWIQFEKESDVLPNLEWMPSTSVEPGADHKIFWGLILPINHPFWKSHRPGDRWGCKCSLSSTDEPPTENLPEYGTPDESDPGLNNNPAQDGKLFSSDHPYFSEAYQGAKKASLNAVRDRFPDYARVKIEPRHIENYRERTKEIRREALPLRETMLKNKEVDREIHISKSGIKEWLNQPHEHYAHKNELLLKIEEVFSKAKYKGATADHKGIKGLKESHLFEISILGDKSWIIVREFQDGHFYLHSITDSKRILEFIKKKGGTK